MLLAFGLLRGKGHVNQKPPNARKDTNMRRCREVSGKTSVDVPHIQPFNVVSCVERRQQAGEAPCG